MVMCEDRDHSYECNVQTERNYNYNINLYSAALQCCPEALKGELNPKIKLDLNDSFCPLINKYNPHIF